MISLSSSFVPCLQMCFERSSPARQPCLPDADIFPVTAPTARPRSGEDLYHIPRHASRGFQAVTRDAGINDRSFEKKKIEDSFIADRLFHTD